MDGETSPKVPAYSLRDDSELSWYHGVGATRFERSTCGGMLDRASQFGLKFAWPTVPVFGKGGAIIGHESGITARPTAELRATGGYTPDDIELEKYARISACMIRVERRDPNAATVIACLFGDFAQRWAAELPGHGRNGALYHLTAKGKALNAVASSAPDAIQLTAAQRLWDLCVVNKAQPKDARTLALAVCARQAADLERRAREVWHLVQST